MILKIGSEHAIFYLIVETAQFLEAYIFSTYSKEIYNNWSLFEILGIFSGFISLIEVPL